MNVMNDDSHTSTPGGEAAKNAGLATVCVDDVREVLAQGFGKIRQRADILPRVNRADQVRRDAEQFRTGGKRGFHRTFAANSWTGEKADVNVGLLAKSKNGCDGVFLRAADHQASNDMSNPHPRVVRASRL